jgi:hypothetical protein
LSLKFGYSGSLLFGCHAAPPFASTSSPFSMAAKITDLS